MFPRQRLFFFGIYITVSCILCFVGDLFFLSSLNTSGFLNSPNSVEDHATSLSSINYVQTANMLIGLTLEEVVVDTTDLLMVYHSTSLMCFEKPTDFAIPNLGLKQTTQSILIPGGSCSLEEKARNIISWYLEENRNTKVVFLCDNIDSSEGEPIYTRSDKLMESEGSKVPLCVLSATRGSAIALIKESARLRDEKLQLKIHAHNGFQLQSKNKFQVVMYELMASVLIAILSLMITAGVLFWRWGESFTVEINREGLLILYSREDDDHIDPNVLLSEEQVLKLPEIQFDAIIDEECPPNKALVQNMCTSIMCSVCIDDFEKGEILRVLPCGHIYHTDCIIPWLTTRAPNCPMCKASIDNSEKRDKRR